ncbi:MAG: amidase [Thermoleophilia bacterium]|nr:amidase [Thermoleophilia bacterium]
MEAVLARIDEVEPEVNAWIHLERDGALAQAKAADRRKRRPLLYGIPICVKDVIDVAGMPTTAGSANWSRMPVTDADAVGRLRAAGAIVVGKGNTNEFAFGIDGRNSHWGDCHNPDDPSRLSGGSSSGPAAATASGMALGGLGTDTSGSIRVPASLCGLVGMRPTLNLIPMHGVFPLAHSYDVVGPLGRTAGDVAILMSALLGRDAPEPMIAPIDPAELRVAIAEDLLERAGEDVAALIAQTTAELERRGATLARVRVPEIQAVDNIHRTIQLYEVAQVHSGWFEVLKDDYEEPVRDRLEEGRKITASEYEAAQEDRIKVIAGFAEAMKDCDVLLAPATPVTAPLLASDTVTIDGDEISQRSALLSCVTSLSQLESPVITVPIGRIDGLPAGLQILGRPETEPLLLGVAGAVEAVVA